MMLYPIITNDPEIKPVNKAYSRDYSRAVWLKPNTINSIFDYTPQEKLAMDYVEW